jgi:Protein of unknown function (DUF2971)
MRLFKYVAAPEAVAAMLGGSLKFTPVGELNDPMEVFPFFDEAEVRESLDALRQNGCSEEQFEWLVRQQNLLGLLAPEMIFMPLPKDRELVGRIYGLAAYEHLPLMKQMLVATIGAIRSKVGILSLSERSDCVPMWAHYARDAAGFAIALDGLERRYPGDETGSLNVAKPVLYSERFLGMTFDPPSQDRLFFAKIDDWRYEKEWRVVRALKQCRQVDRPGSPLFLDDVPLDHVAAVICGWKVPDEVYDDVSRLAAEVNPAVTVARTKIVEGRIVLDRDLPPAS